MLVARAKLGNLPEREVLKQEVDLHAARLTIQNLLSEAEYQKRLIGMSRQEAEAVQRLIRGDRQAATGLVR
ncbi:hypothetical protein [Nonomuraea sp. NPDC049480]|uniref:hypothetical protein n=1 Tax=Nonomuraea sp. NPDC049480 TaxID=3364353 RepID=UPI0037915D3D